MAADDEGARPSTDHERSIAESNESTWDAHADCSLCIGPLDPSAVPAATAVALVGYGRLAYGELVQRDDLIVDAYGMVLPDGRVVTYTDDPHGNRDPGARVWRSVDDAASYWGSCVLRPDPQSDAGAASVRPPAFGEP